MKPSIDNVSDVARKVHARGLFDEIRSRSTWVIAIVDPARLGELELRPVSDAADGEYYDDIADPNVVFPVRAFAGQQELERDDEQRAMDACEELQGKRCYSKGGARTVGDSTDQNACEI